MEIGQRFFYKSFHESVLMFDIMAWYVICLWQKKNQDLGSLVKVAGKISGRGRVRSVNCYNRQVMEKGDVYSSF